MDQRRSERESSQGKGLYQPLFRWSTDAKRGALLTWPVVDPDGTAMSEKKKLCIAYADIKKIRLETLIACPLDKKCKTMTPKVDVNCQRSVLMDME